MVVCSFSSGHAAEIEVSSNFLVLLMQMFYTRTGNYGWSVPVVLCTCLMLVSCCFNKVQATGWNVVVHLMFQPLLLKENMLS